MVVLKIITVLLLDQDYRSLLGGIAAAESVVSGPDGHDQMKADTL